MIQKVNLIDSISLEKILPEATQKFMKTESHNNGWCCKFEVFFLFVGKKEYDDYMQEINDYFLSQGIKPNEIVYIHYSW